MTDERLEAVRRVRAEADKLRLVCIAVAGKASLLHLAYNQGGDPKIPLDQKLLLDALKALPGTIQ